MGWIQWLKDWKSIAFGLYKSSREILKATQQDPLCTLCRDCECGHYDYVEGIGPVCVSCNGF